MCYINISLGYSYQELRDSESAVSKGYDSLSRFLYNTDHILSLLFCCILQIKSVCRVSITFTSRAYCLLRV